MEQYYQNNCFVDFLKIKQQTILSLSHELITYFKSKIRLGETKHNHQDSQTQLVKINKREITISLRRGEKQITCFSYPYVENKSTGNKTYKRLKSKHSSWFENLKWCLKFQSKANLINYQLLNYWPF